MLTNIRIKNVALIKNLELDFLEGLNILSGETGAGKSIIIDSLNFVLGERADKSLIRFGEDVAEVEASFWCADNQELTKALSELGIEDEDGVVILRRNLNQAGRSDIRINGRAVTSKSLKNITQYLCDIHGQHEHQSLLRISTHVDILDKFGDKTINSLKQSLVQEYLKYKGVLEKLNNFGSSEERAREIDMLDYAIREIDKAELYDGVDEEIAIARKKLQNTERLSDAVRGADYAISGGDSGSVSAEDAVYKAYNLLSSAEKYDEELSDYVSRLESVRIELRDIADSLSSIANGYVYSADYANSIEEKYDLIRSLKRKYGPEISDILNYRERSEIRRNELENSEEETLRLEKEKKVLEQNLYDIAKRLSEERRKVAKDLEKLISIELSELGMKGTLFSVDFSETPSKDDFMNVFTEKGIDNVEFLISPNKGEPLKSLSKIISGGEMSRFMLALKVIFAKLDGIGTLVFDEIDTGISGVIAYEVAKKLYAISKSAQVIAVTHLPQLAAAADQNYLIEKSVVDGVTVTRVVKLDESGKEGEVARLSGGTDGSTQSMLHARELIASFGEFKQSV